jgi:hypothetical protein
MGRVLHQESTVGYMSVQVMSDWEYLGEVIDHTMSKGGTRSVFYVRLTAQSLQYILHSMYMERKEGSMKLHMGRPLTSIVKLHFKCTHNGAFVANPNDPHADALQVALIVLIRDVWLPKTYPELQVTVTVSPK